MSDIYDLPDATKPFESPASERAHFEHPRYKTDPAFRDAVMARAILGTENAPVSRHRIGSGVVKATATGEATVHPSLRINFTDQDVADKNTEIGLRKEIAAIKENIAALDRDAVARGEQPKGASASTPYPSENCPELIADMTHPLYRESSAKGEAFREHVTRRLSVTN